MLENLMLASKFDNSCPKFAERTTRARYWVYNSCPQFAREKSKRYSKNKIYYMVQYNYSFIIKHIMVISPPLVFCKARNLYNILPYKKKTNGFLMVSLKKIRNV